MKTCGQKHAAAWAVLAYMLLSWPARAEHADNERITDNTPHVLRADEVRVGLWKVETGVPNRRVQLGTYTFPWIPWVLGAQLVNAHGKWKMWESERFSVAGQLGLFYMDLDNLDAPVTFVLVPMDLFVAYEATSSLSLNLKGTYTAAEISGDYDSEEIGAFQGAVAGSNLQAVLSGIWQLSQRTALIAEFRASMVLGVSGRLNSEVRVDEYTTVELAGTANGETSDLTGASVGIRAHWAWDRFNLRLGLTYGNYNIGGINFVVPTALPVPEIDLFWRL